jgi:hypothetical protein
MCLSLWPTRLTYVSVLFIALLLGFNWPALFSLLLFSYLFCILISCLPVELASVKPSLHRGFVFFWPLSQKIVHIDSARRMDG